MVIFAENNFDVLGLNPKEDFFCPVFRAIINNDNFFGKAECVCGENPLNYLSDCSFLVKDRNYDGNFFYHLNAKIVTRARNYCYLATVI